MNIVMSLKIDKKVKEEATKIAKSAGLTLSSLVNSYLRQLIATRRIDIYVPEELTPKTRKVIRAIEAEIKAGKVSKPFENVDDFIADLRS